MEKTNEEILQAQEMSGEGAKKVGKFIPKITVNNSEEEKIVEISGKMETVKVPAKEGFNVTSKEGDEYIKSFFGDKLSAVILKEKYVLRSKHNSANNYYSNEFDDWGDNLVVLSNGSKLFEGSYQEVKENFTVGKDADGRPIKTYNTYLVLYLNIDGEIKKFDLKLGQYNNWFDYKKSFGSDDTFVAYKTNFILSKEKKGDNEFWVCTFEKGEPVVLADQIELQKELKDYFDAKSHKPKETEEKVDEIIVEDIDKEQKDFMAQIPF